VAIGMLLFAGCYTRLAQDQGEATSSQSYSSRCENCSEEVPFVNNYQVCVWERNIFGYPEQRCYYTGYSSSWLYFHNTPWWYRSSYSWYDTRGCPPYYYHDRTSRSCRYYYDYGKPRMDSHTPSHTPPNTAHTPPNTEPRPRPQSRSITSEAPIQSIPSMIPVVPQTPSPSSSFSVESSGGLRQYKEEATEQPQRPAMEQQKPAEQNNRPRPSMRGM
jgi:hypothetical protein